MFWLSSGAMATVQAQSVVTVFAAASLKTALDDVVHAYQLDRHTDKKTDISVSYAASSALARQISYGAPAQIFISANVSWMDEIESQELLVPGSRVDFLANQLVLIADGQSSVSIQVGPDMNLAGILKGERLAMALSTAVPAGVYAREALTSLGQWDHIQGQTAQTDNVRAALRLVALGEAPVGVVYATDALAEPRVKILGFFPAGAHTPIIYPVARLRQGETLESKEFYAYLIGPGAAAIFRRHGFAVLESTQND